MSERGCADGLEWSLGPPLGRAQTEWKPVCTTGAVVGGEASGRRGGRVGAGLLAVFEAVAVAGELEDVDVMGQPVEQRAGEAFGAEDLGLFVEGEIRGHER